jgi:hypothetical protein
MSGEVLVTVAVITVAVGLSAHRIADGASGDGSGHSTHRGTPVIAADQITGHSTDDSAGDRSSLSGGTSRTTRKQEGGKKGEGLERDGFHEGCIWVLGVGYG